MKRIISLILILTMSIVSFCGCSDQNDTYDDDESKVSSEKYKEDSSSAGSSSSKGETESKGVYYPTVDEYIEELKKEFPGSPITNKKTEDDTTSFTLGGVLDVFCSLNDYGGVHSILVEASGFDTDDAEFVVSIMMVCCEPAAKLMSLQSRIDCGGIDITKEWTNALNDPSLTKTIGDNMMTTLNIGDHTLTLTLNLTKSEMLVTCYPRVK